MDSRKVSQGVNVLLRSSLPVCNFDNEKTKNMLNTVFP